MGILIEFTEKSTETSAASDDCASALKQAIGTLRDMEVIAFGHRNPSMGLRLALLRAEFQRLASGLRIRPESISRAVNGSTVDGLFGQLKDILRQRLQAFSEGRG